MVSDSALSDFLSTVVADDGLHVRWLNTLSLLEFMGTRKIARSMAERRTDEQALRHLAEEARHAHFFKRMIRKVQPDADPAYKKDELLCGFAAARYFHKLDARVRSEVLNLPCRPKDRTELCFLYVTTLIEERADTVYSLYDTCLQERQIPIRLGGLIQEEAGHMEDMLRSASRIDPDFAERLKAYREIEAELFAGFFQALQNATQPVAA